MCDWNCWLLIRFSVHIKYMHITLCHIICAVELFLSICAGRVRKYVHEDWWNVDRWWNILGFRLIVDKS